MSGLNVERAPWYRVRPAFRWTLILCTLAWVCLLGHESTRGAILDQQFGVAARFAVRNFPAILDSLACMATGAMIAEAMRTSRRCRVLLRKAVRHIKLAQAPRIAAVSSRA
jgi:hypothetical protein